MAVTRRMLASALSHIEQSRKLLSRPDALRAPNDRPPTPE
jgi:hypothetical protein